MVPIFWSSFLQQKATKSSNRNSNSAQPVYGIDVPLAAFISKGPSRSSLIFLFLTLGNCDVKKLLFIIGETIHHTLFTKRFAIFAICFGVKWLTNAAWSTLGWFLRCFSSAISFRVPHKSLCLGDCSFWDFLEQ